MSHLRGGTFVVNGTSALVIAKSTSTLLGIAGFTTVIIPPYSARWIQPFGKDPVDELDGIGSKRDSFSVHLTLHRR